MMLKTIEGIYRYGKIELIEPLTDLPGEARVIVTFLEPQWLDLRSRGLDETQAAELRARLATFTEDWDSLEMDIYDNYQKRMS